MTGLGLPQRFDVLAPQVCREEIRGLGEGQVEVSFEVDSDRQVASPHPEDVSTSPAVLRDEVEVVARHAHRACVFGCPEPHERPPDAL